MASSTVTNSKYLDYEGLSHLKTVLDARYAPSNTHGYLPLSGGALTGPLVFNGSDTDRNVIRINCTSGDASKIGEWGYTLKFLGSGSGVNNALALYADNSTATTQVLATKWLNDGSMYGRSILPHTNNTFDLGSSSLKWSNVYATTFNGNLKGSILSSVTNSSSASITEIPQAIRFDSYLAANYTSGFGEGYNNAILTVGRFNSTKYASQLGFSGNGKLYYRSFTGVELDDSKTWSQIAFTSDIPTKVSQLTNDVGYTTANGHTHSKLGSTSITFTPAETALTPDQVYTLVGGTTIKRGTWSYAGNGYISNDTTGCGVIDLAGTTVIQADNGSTAYTQLYLTPATGSTTGCKTNEIFMYNNNGSGYSPSWTRVLTNRNYTEYCVTNDVINTLTDDTVAVVPNIPTSQIVNSGALRQFWVNVRNIIEDNEFVCASALTDLNTRLDNINASISLSTPVSTTKYNILGSPTNGGNLNTAYCSTSVYMQGNNLYATSDARLKDFREDIEVDLEKLRKLPKKYFTWKGESMIDIGTSAQELLKLYPELVSYDEVNDVYAVDYVKLSVIALAAVDTLYDRLKSTEDRLKAIEDKLSKLS